MSANNYLLINRNDFTVTMKDADSEIIIGKAKQGKDLEDAIDIATKWEKEDIIAYGVHFTEKVNDERN